MRRTLTVLALTGLALVPATGALAGEDHNNGRGNCRDDSSVGQPARGEGHGGYMAGGESSCDTGTGGGGLG